MIYINFNFSLNETALKFLKSLKIEDYRFYKEEKFKEVEKIFSNTFQPYKIIQTKVIEIH